MHAYTRIVRLTKSAIPHSDKFQARLVLPADIGNSLFSQGTEFLHVQLLENGEIRLRALSSPQDAPPDNGVTIEQWEQNS